MCLDRQTNTTPQTAKATATPTAATNHKYASKNVAPEPPDREGNKDAEGVNNASRAMPEGGQLKIIACQVFTPIFTTKAKGQGLGLAVVKRLMRARGGTISFGSTVGVGTKFTIKVPLEKS